MPNKAIVLLTAVIMIFSCRRDEIYTGITSALGHPSEPYYVVLITGRDCSSCILGVERFTNPHIPVYGLYYAPRHEKDLKKLLLKLYPGIRWTAVKDESLMKKLFKRHPKGPYVFLVEQNSAIPLR